MKTIFALTFLAVVATIANGQGSPAAITDKDPVSDFLNVFTNQIFPNVQMTINQVLPTYQNLKQRVLDKTMPYLTSFMTISKVSSDQMLKCLDEAIKNPQLTEEQKNVLKQMAALLKQASESMPDESQISGLTTAPTPTPAVASQSPQPATVAPAPAPSSAPAPAPSSAPAPA